MRGRFEIESLTANIYSPAIVILLCKSFKVIGKIYNLSNVCFAVLECTVCFFKQFMMVRNLSNVCFAVLKCILCSFLKQFMMVRNLSNVCFAVFCHNKTRFQIYVLWICLILRQNSRYESTKKSAD